MKHKFLADHYEFAEEDYPDIKVELDQSFEDSIYSDADLKKMIYEEIKSFNKEVFETPNLLDSYDEQYHRVKRSKRIDYSIGTREGD